MDEYNRERKLDFENKIISKVVQFNKEHRFLGFLGVAYAVLAVIGYNICSLFYNNGKKLTCLASVLMLFALSSSFSYSSVAAVDEVRISHEDTIVAGKNTGTQVKEEKEEQQAVRASFNRDDWKIILVNKQHPIPEGYDFKLGTITGGLKCDERVVSPLKKMISAAKDDGVELYVCSPYRNSERQTMLFDKKVNRYVKNGMSYMDAYRETSQAVTIPGSSEHQIGLAIDFITDNYTALDEGFAKTDAGRWLSENAWKYGFILRYPKAKESITSIEFEPWHYRYVGEEAAEVIAKNNICLEEFWNRYVGE
ncbi:MAG: M15 family metallopeptidase [Butyrivibrio sp.]|nr:M15 family metallopeptidase [Butyrivibrio sp.]